MSIKICNLFYIKCNYFSFTLSETRLTILVRRGIILCKIKQREYDE